jgi:predicted glycoside hydrolase/deacetylase ChbG (UPF0249 family)
MITEITTAVVDAFTGLLNGVGTGIVDLFKNLILDGTGKLTTFATWGFVMMGLSLAIGLIVGTVRKIG